MQYLRANKVVGFVLTGVLIGCGLGWAQEKSPALRLPQSPTISPGGKQVAFAWRGDLWLVAARGGEARRLTWHPGVDSQPLFSPKGKQIAFASNRHGGKPQIYIMDLAGGAPRRLTYNSEGAKPLAWFPDGKELLVSGSRVETGQRRLAGRLYRISAEKRGPERLLFNTYVSDFGAAISPDGKQLLFTREGEKWWRKGYRGDLAAQVWLYDFATGDFRQLAAHSGGNRWPLWDRTTGDVLYVGQESGTFNLWRLPLGAKKATRITDLADDGMHFPAISNNGSTIVFRRLFDLLLLDLKSGEMKPVKITVDGDNIINPVYRKKVTQAQGAAFTPDGKQIAFVAADALWVMDKELREPLRVTPVGGGLVGEVVFIPDGKGLLYTCLSEGNWDIWLARPADPKRWWWQQKDGFKCRRLTNDSARESGLKFSPTGEQVAFVKGNGDLWVMGKTGEKARLVHASWSRPRFDWSPDGKWFVYSQADPDMGYAINVWLLPLAGGKPFNVSLHPNRDYSPVWSPDGRKLAWVSYRNDNKADICYLFLRMEDEQKNRRDEKLAKAIKAMGKTAKKSSGKKAPGGKGATKLNKLAELFKKGRSTKPDKPAEQAKPTKATKVPAKKKAPPVVKIDRERIHERIHRIAMANMTESNPFWGPKSENLYFNARSSGGRRFMGMSIASSGLYGVKFTAGRAGSPKKAGSGIRGNPVWLSQAKKFGLLSGGKPTLFSPPSKSTAYTFSLAVELDLRQRLDWAFDEAWRYMRDGFYDPSYNNRDWDAIRAKYGKLASQCYGRTEFGILVNLMLGELNGSHLGFSMFANGHPYFAPSAQKDTWREQTWHLGLGWDDSFAGPGLRVKEVIPKGPTDREITKILPNEIILKVNGQPVDVTMDLTMVFNQATDLPFSLVVKDAAGKERAVEVVPVNYNTIRRLVFNDFLHRRREQVEQQSKGRFGYLLIEAMNMSSFGKFQEALYAAGYGKDGLVIDVRDNGGGSTTDRLLTALCQPRHAITIPRGGGKGYPRDRIVYARWNKPIVILCNQRSYSNAEIFTHAIKVLGRGKVIGVGTAGGVVSTGGAMVLGMGTIRMPTRGWFLLKDGADMERNGAQPDFLVWPKPGEDVDPARDRQLKKAIQVLNAEVKAWQAKPDPKPRYAGEQGR